MTIPKEVKDILQQLEAANFQAFVVGGCVRDLLLKREPKDWDIATNATPEEIQKIFPDSFYENTFGTVGVKIKSNENSSLNAEVADPIRVIEVTTFRTESGYSDQRHPDEVKFAKTIEEDLQRRDFTINAMALSFDYKLSTTNYKLIDPFAGQADLKSKLNRAVGNPGERFREDALRLMRAVRLATELSAQGRPASGWNIEAETMAAIQANAGLLQAISAERVRDELVKIVNTAQGDAGIQLLENVGLLQYILPELREGIGVEQNLHHIYTVWEHNLRALRYTCEKGYSLAVRLAALLHDVGKPRSKRGEGRNSTFYAHEMIGAKMTGKLLARLKFLSELADKITKLVRWHLFYYNVGEVTETSVRRLVANIGKENVEDLIKVREGDRIGSGTPKAMPYKLRHLKFMIDKVARDPLSPKMLKLNGSELMTLLQIDPGPKVGMIIAALMNEVLDDPAKNTKEYLSQRARELIRFSEADLNELAKQGKEKLGEEEEKEIQKIKQKHYV